ncbi:UxaA family hydrolase, partial [Campylobacter jejuni]|nr:UxaA family hydrolase [Campylobacter jejuni]
LSDFVIDEGGAVILAETTELIGCEAILAKRAKNDEIAKKVYDKILAYENLVKSFHADIRGANPSPGNMA